MQLTIRKNDLTPGQWALKESTSAQTLLCGGYGSGKTTGLDIKLLQLKSENPDVPGMLVAASWRQMWRVTLRRLFSFLKLTLQDRRLMPKVCDKQGECYLDFGDGVPIFLASAHNPESLEGIDVGYLLGDELRLWPHRSYQIAIARRRAKCRRPQSCFSSTPDFNWLVTEFGQGVEGRELIVSPTYENERNLVPGYIENLRLSYSKRLQKAVIDGQFTVMSGAVYETFDPGLNSPWVIDYNPARNLERKTYLAVDPGYRRSAWIWIHQVGPTQWIVFDEMMADDSSDTTNVERVNSRGWPIDEIWVDPAAGGVQELVGIDTLKALKLIKTRMPRPIRMVSPPWNSIAFGVDKLRVLLGGEELPIRLQFSRDLIKNSLTKYRSIGKDLAGLCYPEIKDGRSVTDIPVDDGVTSHGADSIRYWAVGMWLTIPQLRSLDAVLTASKTAGFRAAA